MEEMPKVDDALVRPCEEPNKDVSITLEETVMFEMSMNLDQANTSEAQTIHSEDQTISSEDQTIHSEHQTISMISSGHPKQMKSATRTCIRSIEEKMTRKLYFI